MNFDIVEATPNMVYEIAQVHIKSWQSAYKNIIPRSYLDNLSIEERANRYKFGNALDKGHHFFAAKLGDKIIGFLYLCKCRDEGEVNSGEIAAIYLLPEYWGEGYGGNLMNFSLDFLSGAGYESIAIWVLEENNRAINFYKKYGFDFDGNKKTIVLGKELVEVRYLKTIK